MDEGWLFGNNFDDDRKTHPMLKPFNILGERVSYHAYLDGWIEYPGGECNRTFIMMSFVGTIPPSSV